MVLQGTPNLASSTNSTSSAPPWSPCPPYKAYRPSPPAETSSIGTSTTSSSSSLTSQNNTSSSTTTTTKPQSIDPSNLPGGKKSLAGISLRSFLLGQVAGVSIISTIFLLYTTSTPFWRPGFFLASLSVFHFLEYYVTARYNVSYATISAFLLSSNGAAYNIAHTSAMVECVISRIYFSPGYLTYASLLFGGVRLQVILGLVFMLVGQSVRTLAMAQAGASFTHTIQQQRREGHLLVTGGMYAILRHPSYFGFFWWGVGTQLVLGNVVCLVAYVLVLWRFFSERIRKEEKLLIRFFGKEYVDYRETTRVGIPGIP